MKKAVFFDRDGTLNKEAGYIKDLANLTLIEGAAEAVTQLKAAGYLAILITNQSGPARGYYPETWVNTLNQKLQELLQGQGTGLDAIYYCPHLPDGKVPEYTRDCDCRKPGTALFRQAKEDFDIDLAASYMLGDKATDVDAGHNAGCKSILLKTGYGQRVLAGEYQYVPKPDYIAEDVLDAATWILKNH